MAAAISIPVKFGFWLMTGIALQAISSIYNGLALNTSKYIGLYLFTSYNKVNRAYIS